MEILARHSPGLLILAGRDLKKCEDTARVIANTDSKVAVRFL